MAIPSSARFRVIYHEPICPTCGSSNITTDDIDITDGLTEEAFICLACGEAWPLACVTDWDTQAGGHGAPSGVSPPAGGTS
jgi:hypothetical protein